jgi:parallel beta-helix repeat protein
VVGARSGGLVTEKGCQRIHVQNFSSTDNHFDGIALYETENSIFSELYLHDNPYAGISLDIRFNHNIISDAVLTNNGKQGIFMRDSRDNIFLGLQIRGSGEQGLFLAQVDSDTTKPAAGNTFIGLVVADSTQAGMRVNDASCINNMVESAQFINNPICISEATPGLVQQNGVICR